MPMAHETAKPSATIALADARETLPAQSARFVLLAIGVAALMTSLDSSIVNAVLPVITHALGSDVAATQWIVTIYLLVLSGLMLTFGRLGDLYGHKRVYLWGFGVFVVGSAVCGVAPSLLALISARAFQGIGAAMLTATSPAILTSSFPARQRGRALGLFTTATYLGLAIGPSLGGWLADQVSWRAVFYINLPIGVLAFALSARAIPLVKPSSRLRERFDVPGAVVFTAALVLLLLALDQGHAWGWTSWLELACLGGATLSLIVFLRYEAVTPSPMLDLRLFHRRLFSAAIASAVLNYIGAFTTVFLMPFYLISGRGLSPSQAGLILMAMPLCMMLTAPLSGALSDRVGSRLPATLGMLIQTVGLVLLSQLRLETPIGLVIGGLILIGLGIGLFSSPNTSAALGTVPPARRGVASGVLGTARNVGMMLGIAMAGAVFSTLLSQAGAEPSNVSLIASIRAAFAVAAGCTGLGALASFVRDRPGVQPSEVVDLEA
jgi:EmrB/QacA subfamily drug resistance transporter